MLPPLFGSEQTSSNYEWLAPTTARAPGKIILAGEHFVVLGAPGVAMAINLHSSVQVRPKKAPGVDVEADIPLRFLGGRDRDFALPGARKLLHPLKLAAEATLRYIESNGRGLSLNVECEIPVAAGLGSSASTTVAIISAVARSHGIELDRREIFKIAFVPENFLHGKPSGVDQAACIYGGMIQFTRPSSVKRVQLKKEPILLVCDTGIHHATRTLVGAVVKKSQKERVDFQDHLAEVRNISRGVVRALKRGDEDDLGSLMYRNHELLQKIGVSHPALDRLVEAAKRAGAPGAKMTGAGGGGCMIVLCQSNEARHSIARKLRRTGATPYNISIDTMGVH